MSQIDRSHEIYTWAGYVRAAQSGDSQAQEALFTETYNFAYYTALQYMKNPDDALDMTQEAFIKVWQALPRLQNAETYMAWLKRIVVNTCLNRLNRKQPELFGDQVPEEQDAQAGVPGMEGALPFHEVAEQQSAELMQSILQELPDKQRIAMTLVYLDEFSVAEAAGAMACSANTIKSRLLAGRKKLAELIAAKEKSWSCNLFSAAPVSVLYYVLNDMRFSLIDHAAAREFVWNGLKAAGLVGGAAAAVTGGVAASGTGSAAAGTGTILPGAGSAASGTGMSAGSGGIVSSGAGMSAGSSAVTSGAGAAGAATAGTATGSAAAASAATSATATATSAAAGIGLGTKILVGVLAAGLVTGGSVAAVKVVRDRQADAEKKPYAIVRSAAEDPADQTDNPGIVPGHSGTAEQTEQRPQETTEEPRATATVPEPTAPPSPDMIKADLGRIFAEKDPYQAQTMGANPVYYYQHPTLDIALDFRDAPLKARTQYVIPFAEGFHVYQRSTINWLREAYQEKSLEDAIAAFEPKEDISRDIITVITAAEKAELEVWFALPENQIGVPRSALYSFAPLGDQFVCIFTDMNTGHPPTVNILADMLGVRDYNESMARQFSQPKNLPFQVVASSSQIKDAQPKVKLDADGEWALMLDFLKTNTAGFEWVYGLPLEAHHEYYHSIYSNNKDLKPLPKAGSIVNYEYGTADLNGDGIKEYIIHCYSPFASESSMHVGNEGYWAIFQATDDGLRLSVFSRSGRGHILAKGDEIAIVSADRWPGWDDLVLPVISQARYPFFSVVKADFQQWINPIALDLTDVLVIRGEGTDDFYSTQQPMREMAEPVREARGREFLAEVFNDYPIKEAEWANGITFAEIRQKGTSLTAAELTEMLPRPQLLE